MIRPVFFIWAIVPVALYMAYHTTGLPIPYLNWSYDFRIADGFDPWAERAYTRCTYASPSLDYITIYPADGYCPRIKFFMQKSGRV